MSGTERRKGEGGMSGHLDYSGLRVGGSRGTADGAREEVRFCIETWAN